MCKFAMKLRNSTKVLISLQFIELVYENNPFIKNTFAKHALFSQKTQLKSDQLH